MENVLKYYQFSDFFLDKSSIFDDNEICYTVLNDTHFLIFEKVKETAQYNLYVSKYNNQNEIGVKQPQILELVKKNYDKSSPNDRVALRKYIEIN